MYFHFSVSCTGEGNGNPLQYSCLENPRDGGAWWATVHGAAQSWTRLRGFTKSGCSSMAVLFLLFFLSVMSDLLQPHGLQHARLPCPSLSCGVCSNSWALRGTHIFFHLYVMKHGLAIMQLLRPWDSPSKNTGVGCHFLLQGIFPIQGSNPGFPHWRQML